jgi:hypothetical protein
VRTSGLEPPPRCAPEDAVPEIAKIIQDTLAALQSRGMYMSLTAGYDSRLLLACARSVIESVKFFTFMAPQGGADEQISTALADRLGLSWEALSAVPATAEQSEAFLRRTGHVISGRIREIHPTLASLDPARIVAPGLGGELARGHYWRDAAPTGRLDADQLARRLRIPAHPQFLDSVGDWLTELGDAPTNWILDLAFLELDLGCWGGPQMYGTDPYGDTLLPLSHPRVFELALGLPEPYRAADRLAIDVCRLLWPELLSLPFNRLRGWPRVRQGLARRGRRLARALRR